MTSALLAVVQLLQGTVVSSETGLPIGYSVVNLAPNAGKQFTDGAGRFTFANVQAGGYLLSVRQIGYNPLDTQIVIRGDSARLTVALRRLAIELPPVSVTAQPCTRPGPPDAGTDPVLAAVFEQLQENARRFALLADSYPFRYDLELAERTVNRRGDTSRAVVRTLRFSSDDHHPYAPGRVVEPAWGPWGNPDRYVVIRSADLRDLGNQSFVANHCFRLAGRDTIGGETLVRIDFEPAARINSADMAGAAYLDTLTYQLRYTETSLTRPERSSLTDVASMTFRTGFRDVAPGVPLQDSLTAVTTYRHGRPTKIETQRTVEVRFRRQPPPL